MRISPINYTPVAFKQNTNNSKSQNITTSVQTQSKKTKQIQKMSFNSESRYLKYVTTFNKMVAGKESEKGQLGNFLGMLTWGTSSQKNGYSDIKIAEMDLPLIEKTLNEAEKVSKKYSLSLDEAIRYNQEFMEFAQIPPTGDGDEIGLNAVKGYGVEKYLVASDFILPIILKQNYFGWYKSDEANVMNGLLLYGPPGSGKTYISEKACEHLAHFNVAIKNIKLVGRNHEKNAEIIKDAFEEGKRNYMETGQYTVINFTQDIDNIFTDKSIRNTTQLETQTFISYAKDCAKNGVTWIGTANNPKQLDPAILAPQVTEGKIAIGNMDNFVLEETLKYFMMKHKQNSSIDDFDFEKVAKALEERNITFTPANLEGVIKSAKQQKMHPKQPLTADMIIATIDMLIDEMKKNSDIDYTTLDPETKEEFNEDQEYIKQFSQ